MLFLSTLWCIRISHRDANHFALVGGANLLVATVKLKALRGWVLILKF
jgi:hypothetical protein